jgi:L-threonylcarbamoyladenylate synthase
MTPGDVAAFERCIDRGGVAVFPADTVYGLASNPGSKSSVERMYALKGRDQGRPAAIMFFRLERALAALDWLEPRTVDAVGRLLPGPVTVVVPNPNRRFSLAGGGGGLGVRVPRLEDALAPLAEARVAVLQTSANPTGGKDTRRVGDLVAEIRAGVDIVLDGGELSGVPSSVVDLTEYERTGRWEVIRETAVDRVQLARILQA